MNWLQNHGLRGVRRLSFTYAPKLEPVKKGDCRQTIRLIGELEQTDARARLPRDPVADGTELVLYAWKGKPYKSKWDWTRYEKARGSYLLLFVPGYVTWMTLTRADDSEQMEASVNGCRAVYIMVDEAGLNFWGLNDTDLGNIAREDGMPEPSHIKLASVLQGINHLNSLDWTLWDVIRW